MGNSDFHIKKDKNFKPKELFKDMAAIIQKRFKNTGDFSILDIGCASGELPFYLKNRFKTDDVYGFDISPKLIKNAKERFGGSKINFTVANAKNFKFNRKFDVITAASILSYFDNPYEILNNIFKHLNKKGLIIITGIFNDWNLDVKLKYKMDKDKKWGDKSVINQFSTKRIGDYLTKKGYKYKFSEQIMPFKIVPHKDHPIRSWTINLNGKRFMMSGLQLAYNIKILQIW
ncbi:MAG: hypothetical protein A2817_03375 [Candidatus Yanofskybacteria bacterium RIFCSPHIGHO2_01_FULL_39_8b]|uniref:Methyltransferase domain-containing protein n=1 Tax=Candidatus Yanofskybacteria bacterium RIFCSPHIGHO2_01_FULL_39_8b TaxID=1802659 RepID=A0A1F8EEZ2_9BACT|nr:MAG: hypothetical protein A2817_03375 [Candidatus Yanofskybacteria bacterium RIFCSPHIGHO2_01_FULL_39_8b]